MKTVIISVIGISSLFLVVMVQKNINERTWQHEQLEEALSVAMSQTLEEVVMGDCYGITNQNEMMAAFLQAMLCKLNQEVDLTVKVHRVNYILGQMDMEAIGTYKTANGQTHTVSVRRNLMVNERGVRTTAGANGPKASYNDVVKDCLS